jgi:hypothetical protein
MDPKKWCALQVVTNNAFDVEVAIRHLDARYSLKVYDDPKSTRTGMLRLCSIDPDPAHSDLPSFFARWDHNHNTVDIDLGRGGRIENDFHGHHTVLASPGTCECDIHAAEGHIFSGSITLKTGLGLRVGDSLEQPIPLL